MGNQVTTSTREVALQATLPVRKVCDQILEYMLKEINIKDFYLLATKRECSRYVIFLASQLNRTFRSLRFAPARGAAGVIYFQPIDILQKPSTEQEAERQSLCIFLAYFYVRIFQIYGSLTLTLIDDANVFVKFRGKDGLTEEQRAAPYRGYAKPLGTVGAPNPVPGRFDYFRPDTFERDPAIYPYKISSNPLFRPPSQRNYKETRKRRDSDRLRDDYYRDDRSKYSGLYGGAGQEVLDDDELGRFQFLRNLLSEKTIEKARIVDQLDFTLNIGHPFLSSALDGSFKLNADEFKADKSNINEGSVFVRITSDRKRTRFYEIKMEVVNRISNPTLRITAIRYQSLLDDAVAAQQLRYGRARPSLRNDLDGERLRKILSDIYGAENGEFQIVNIGDSFKIEARNGQETPIQFLKSLKDNMDIVLGLRRASDYRDLTSRDNRVQGEINSNLDIQNTLIYLQEKKPMAHCIARGLQLLGNRDPEGNFMSSACETKFLIGKKDFDNKVVDRTGLPEPGGKLTSVAGIQALSNLFYDTIKFKSTNLTRSNKAIDDYIRFMEEMTKLFVSGNESDGKKAELLKEIESVKGSPEQEKESKLSNPQFMKLDDITDSQMEGICRGLKIEPINPKSPQGREILKQVSRLFGRQIQHAANCGQIFRQLFSTVSINGIVSVRINKTVFVKGILELNRINDQARNLLINYYRDCETYYRQGVDVIKKMADGQKLDQEILQKTPLTQSMRGGGATRKKNRTIYV